MSQSFRLYRLQQLDSQLDRNRSRLEEIKLELADDSKTRTAQTNTDQAETELQASRKTVKRAEDAVGSQRIKIEQTEASLYGGKVNNPKELQDLQNEAASLKRYLSVLEDRELEAMLAEEAAAVVFFDMQEALKAIQMEQDRKYNQLLEEQDRILKEFPRLEEERKAAAASIPPEELSLYEQIRRQRRGIGIALVKEKACSACGTTLSATLLDAARISPKLQRCETCGRILYVG
jgi:hypothetical protein